MNKQITNKKTMKFRLMKLLLETTKTNNMSIMNTTRMKSMIMIMMRTRQSEYLQIKLICIAVNK